MMKSFLTACTLAALACSAAAQTLDVRFQALRLGDDEAHIRQLLEKPPSEVMRQTTLGVDRTRLIFEADGTTYTVTLLANHLVDKKAETKEATKKSWLPF